MIKELKACIKSWNDNDIFKNTALTTESSVLWIPMNEHRRSNECIQDYQINALLLCINYEHVKLTKNGWLTVSDNSPQLQHQISQAWLPCDQKFAI